MSNYEWQNQYSQQRINSRMREAQAHRLAGQAPARPGLFAWIRRALSGRKPARRPDVGARSLQSETQV